MAETLSFRVVKDKVIFDFSFDIFEPYSNLYTMLERRMSLPKSTPSGAQVLGVYLNLATNPEEYTERLVARSPGDHPLALNAKATVNDAMLVNDAKYVFASYFDGGCDNEAATVKLAPRKLDRSRQENVFKTAGLACLESSKVLVVGCGAVGLEVARNLVLSGMKEVVLCHDARFETFDHEASWLRLSSQQRADLPRSVVPMLRKLDPDPDHIVSCLPGEALTNPGALAERHGIDVVVLTQQSLFDPEVHSFAASFCDPLVSPSGPPRHAVLVEARGGVFAISTYTSRFDSVSPIGGTKHNDSYRVKTAQSTTDMPSSKEEQLSVTIQLVEASSDEAKPPNFGEMSVRLFTKDLLTVCCAQVLSHDTETTEMTVKCDSAVDVQSLLQAASCMDLFLTAREEIQTIAAASAMDRIHSIFRDPESPWYVFKALHALQAAYLGSPGASAQAWHEEGMRRLVVLNSSHPIMSSGEATLQQAVAASQIKTVPEICTMAGSLAALEVLRLCSRRFGIGGILGHADTKGVLTSTTNVDLSSLRILLVGSGAIGCEMLKNLALAGFQHVTVCDADTVALSNVYRQFLFNVTDSLPGEERFKAVAACDRIKTMYDVSFTPHVGALDVKTVTKGPSPLNPDNFDVIVSAVDSGQTRWELDVLAHAWGKAFVDGGTEGLKGNVHVCYPGVSQSARNEYPRDRRAAFRCTAPGKLSTTNDVILLCLDIFEWLFRDIPSDSGSAPQMLSDVQLDVDVERLWKALLQSPQPGAPEQIATLIHTLLVQTTERLSQKTEGSDNQPYWLKGKPITPVPFGDKELFTLASLTNSLLLRARTMGKVTFDKDSLEDVRWVRTASRLLCRAYDVEEPDEFRVRKVAGHMLDAVLPTTAFVAAAMTSALRLIADTSQPWSDQIAKQVWWFMAPLDDSVFSSGLRKLPRKLQPPIVIRTSIDNLPNLFGHMEGGAIRVVHSSVAMRDRQEDMCPSIRFKADAETVAWIREQSRSAAIAVLCVHSPARSMVPSHIVFAEL
eukprot:m.20654 g.20654  ORF g.20654 m.20654 type:complete len:1016 (-) comp8768_c0_seq2:176-3223(-)